MNPVRFGYMRRVLTEDLAVDPSGKRCLDVGCGGGLLAEEFAKFGCRVTGVDPSEGSLEWDATRCMEPDVHDWDMFIKPRELDDVLRRNGLEPRDMVGLAPAAKPIRLLRDLRRRRRGEITYAELGRRMKIRESGAVWGSYAGYAVRPAASGA